MDKQLIKKYLDKIIKTCKDLKDVLRMYGEDEDIKYEFSLGLEDVNGISALIEEEVMNGGNE